jgi:hypothetical protein
MTNYSKTRELFNKEPKKSPDLKYKDTFPAGFFGEEMAEERWFSQVRNPNSGEFFQLENLKALGVLPADFKDGEKPKNYPLKEVDTIVRIKKADGTEWLTSTQTWIGLYRYGNEINKSFVYLEIYDKPNFFYQPIKDKSKSKSNNTIDNDPNNPFPKFERMATSVVYTKELTLPFTLNLEQLWTLRRPKITLSIKNERAEDSPERGIEKNEDFKKSFDELWQWAITPRFSLDRSVKDQLQDRQYG